MTQRNITSAQSLASAMREIEAELEEQGWIKLEWKRGNSRSISQNDLFHAWCQQFADGLTEIGRPCKKLEAKYWLKAKFLGFEDIKVGKSVIKDQLKSTKETSKGEMFHFMEQCWEYSATTFGIFLTVHEESVFAKLKKEASGQ